MCQKAYVQIFLNHGYDPMAEYFKAFVFIPDLEVILATTPDRFRQFKNLVVITDCSEVFTEIPKNLELQSATWSEYKHHNTIKIEMIRKPLLIFSGGIMREYWEETS